MAEATGLRNTVLPYPIYGVPYGIVIPIFDNDGDLVTAAASLDSEISKNGDTFADCTNEATEIATSSGMYYLLLTATEMTTNVAAIIVKTSTSDAKTTPIVLYPRVLPEIQNSTAQAGAASTITLDANASETDDFYNGCIIYLDGGTGSGQARTITDYVGSTKVATVSPAWATTPDATSTFIIYTTETTNAQVKGLATKAEIRPELMVSTTIATLASQTSFTLTDGSSDDNAYNGCQVMVTDSATEQQKCVGLVSAYTGATKTVTLTSDPGIFTMAVGDTVEILAAPKQLPDAEHGANGGLVTGDANNRIAGIQGTKNTLDDLNDSESSVLLISTTIATLASQTSFTLTAGSGDNDAYDGAFAIITDQTTPTQKCFAVVNSYVGSTKTVELASDPGIFTMAVGDYIDIIAASGWTPGEKEQIRDALGVDGSKNTATGGQLQTVDTNVDSILADTGTDGVVVAAASKTGYALTSAEHTNIADALLKRDWTSVAGEASRSVLEALRFLRNKWSISGGILTVTKEDDATTAWTATVTDDAGADPITGVDPT